MIPRSALYLGLAGLLPFLWAAAGLLVPAIGEFTVGFLGQRFNPGYMLVAYGWTILCFMSGVLWGFATKSNEAKAYALSVLPALWAFFTVGGGNGPATSALIIGFILVFACDVQFRSWGLAPDWWLKLRAFLTLVVLICLGMGVWAA